MKNWLLLVLFGVLVGFTQCKKEEVLRPDNSLPPSNTFNVEGFNWILKDGLLHVETLTNNSLGNRKDYYSFFSSSQKETSLSFTGTSFTSFDYVKQDATMWSFSSNNFVLGDGIQLKYFEYEKTLSGYRVFGLEGGTARPIQVLYVDDQVLIVKTHEARGSFNDINYAYYSKLIFIKQGFICNTCFIEPDPSYINGGLLNSTPTNIPSIINTKWVVTRYNDGFANVFPNDTIEFIDNERYMINNDFANPKSYTLNGIIGNNYLDLTMYNFTTLGGSFSGRILNSFIDDGRIESSRFFDIWGANSDKLVWMVKL
jgi:hypothetical protein